MSKNNFSIFYFLLIVLTFGSGAEVVKVTDIVHDEISELRSDLKDIQSYLDNLGYSNENLKTLKTLTSSVLKISSQIERMESHIAKMEDINSSLREKLNETECSLSTRIIDIENQLASFKKESKKSKNNRGLQGIMESKEVDDAKSNRSPEIENLRKRLFAAGLNMQYTRAMEKCRRANKTDVFIPKTKEENDLWIDFWRETSENNFLFSSAFYPKIFNIKSRKFIWADGYEHPEYYNISVQVSSSSLNRRRISFSRSDICLTYFNKISTDSCVDMIESTFAICETINFK